jgi:hypothetical protein
VWRRLGAALARLDAVAARPETLEESGDALPRLQYELHWASELLAGLEPPPGAAAAHEELVAALVVTRDATAEVAEAVQEGGSAAARRLVPEWRGSLFRVRLARMHLQAAARPAAAPEPSPMPRQRLQLGLIVALLVGVAAFVAGAAEASTGLWVGGLVLVAASLAAQRA